MFEAEAVRLVLVVLGGVSVALLVRITNRANVMTSELAHLSEALHTVCERLNRHSDSIKDLDKKIAVLTRDVANHKHDKG